MWPRRVPRESSAAPSFCGLRLWLVAAVALAALPSAAARFPIEKWECGSEVWESSKSYSHSEVMKLCPHFAGEINHCCVLHDDCYGRQKGQALCDKQFDDCHKKVLEDERASPCKEYTEMAYGIVASLGFFAYGSSGPYQEPTEAELPSLCRPEKTVGVFFDYLYLSCPTIKKSISSCCEQLQLCPDLPLGRNRTECASRAMRCLGGARAEEHHLYQGGHCDRALDRTRKYLALDYIMEGKQLHGYRSVFADVLDHQGFFLLMCIGIVGITLLAFFTFKYYQLRSENKDRKYSTITLSAA